MSTTERDKLMIHDWSEGRAVGELCRENGIGERQFYLILKRLSPPEGRVKRKPTEPRPLSPIHRKIGSRLLNHYYDLGIDRITAANRLGWGSLRLRSVENGFVDLSLFELQDIAAFLRIPMGELFDG